MKRFILLLLIAVLLVSCAAGDDGGTVDVTTAADIGAEVTSETEPELIVPELPEADYGGYVFRAYVPTPNVWASCTFNIDDETGDTVNDAIYLRNRAIEEQFNVVLTETDIGPFDKLQNVFSQSVSAGSDDFDICVQIDRNAFALAIGGYVLSADNLPYVDLSKPWYMHDVMNSMSLGGKIFIIESNENMSLYECTDVLFFNKKIVEDLGLAVPYDLVNDGTWTYDKFFDLSKAAAMDIDGDGVMTEADRFGIISEDTTMFRNIWESSGIQSIVKDSDDMFALNLSGNEKLSNILEKANQNLYGEDKMYLSNGDQVVTLQLFENNLALFHGSMLIRTKEMRAMETDFGIVPYPKYDESQDRYYVRSGGGWPKIVPVHAQNPERTSVIIEALAAESRNTTVPAFKEVNLRTKITRDNESAEMLDLIFDSGFGDVGTFLWLDVRDALVNVVRGSANYTSTVESKSPAFEKFVNDANDAAISLQ